MNYNAAWEASIERAERGEVFDDVTLKSAPIKLQIQELEMQVDRIEKTMALVSEHINPILTPDHPREVKSTLEADGRAESSTLARTLQKQVGRLSNAARRLEDLNSRIEL